MVATSRPEQAALPTISRPQPINLGGRSRVSHLPRYARIADNATRAAFPDSTGQRDRIIFGVAQGLSYRNAALHVLLSTPIFFNFLRAHWHRVGGKNNKCHIANCLTCRLAVVAAYYWGALNFKHEKRNALLAEHVTTLWAACLEIFWGPNAKTSQKIGPANENDESYTESFLLHLLVAIQRQLEASPAEHQTFLRIFTTHVKRFRKCSSVGCRWVSPSFRWEQSLFLPINVQKPIGKHSHTDILAGLKLALEQAPRGLSTRKDSINAMLKCPTCSAATALTMEIVNYPEVLILVRNLDQLAPEDQPDIPLKTTLDMKLLGSSGVKYELVSGASEYKVSPTVTRAVAFARGVRDSTWRTWSFLNHDGTEEQLLDVSQLDQVQRLHTVVQPDHQQTRPGFIFPEVLVFGRSDGLNIKPQDVERMKVLIGYGEESPAPLENLGRESEFISRSVTDIFAQRIGNGLLKFKINLTPADPDPLDSIPFTLDVGYERNGCFWVPEGRIYSRLIPAVERKGDADPSPKGKESHIRFSKRDKGVSTPTGPTTEQIKLLESDGVKPFPIEHEFPEGGPINPFAAVEPQNGNSDDGMELDTMKRFGFAANPIIDRFIQANGGVRNFPARSENKNDRKRQRKNFGDQLKRDINNNKASNNNGGWNNNNHPNRQNGGGRGNRGGRGSRGGGGNRGGSWKHRNRKEY